MEDTNLLFFLLARDYRMMTSGGGARGTVFQDVRPVS